MLGPANTAFFVLSPAFWVYMTFRMTRFQYNMIKRHWSGRDEDHYFWYYDTLYPDLVHDEDDMRYINFRYTDQKLQVEEMTGYYPYDHMRYGDFLHKKEASNYINAPKTEDLAA